MTSGMLNFAATSSVSRAPAWSLLYSSKARLLASYARRVPAAAPFFCTAHRMPLLLPLADIASAPPGYGNACGVVDVGEVESRPLVSLNDCTTSETGPK